MQNKHMEKLRIAIVGKVVIPQKDSCVTQTKIKKNEMNTTDTDMVEYMRQALDERATPDSEAWKRFQDEVEECFPHFRDMVHAEGLRCEEYRICMLLKAGFRSKDTEILLGYKPKTLSTYQKRLLKKIFQVEGSAKEFRIRLRGEREGGEG